MTDTETPDSSFRFKPTAPTPCQAQPEIFFSDKAEYAKAAAAGCSFCPFIVECRLEGLERREYGTWGGLSRNQRSRMGVEGRAKEIERLQRLLAQREES